jgi:hypothetical protein
MQPREIRKITFVEFDAAQKHFLSAAIMPRTYGMVLLATLARDLGFDVRVYCEHIGAIDLERVLDSDLVCFSPLTAAANKTFALADWVRRHSDAPTLAGGTFPTSFRDLCLEHFDYVIRNEGDDAMVELLTVLQQGGDPRRIRGLSYRDAAGAVVHNPDREPVEHLDIVPDLSLVEGYDDKPQWWHLVTERRIRWIVLQATRGCPYTCSFCIAPVMYGRGYRKRSLDNLIEDLRDKLRYGRYFLFMDNCFTADRKYTKALLRRMLDEGIRGSFVAFTRCEATEDEELLGLLKEVGFVNLYMGAESLSEEAFARMHKKQTVDKIVQAARRIQQHGMGATVSFQAGNDEDDRFAVARAVDFGLEHDLDGVYFIATWSWPEWPQPVFPKQRMILKSLDYTTGHFVTHFPLHMKPSTLQTSILEQQRRFWSLGRIPGFLRRGQWERVASLLVQRYALSQFEPAVEAYIPYLEEIEQGYYDAGEELILDKVLQRQVSYRGEFDELYRGRRGGRFANLDRVPPPGGGGMEVGVREGVAA